MNTVPTDIAPLLRIGPVEATPPTALAPMAGHTDVVYRTICRQFGCGIVFTELVSAEGLVRNGRKTWALIESVAEERPVGIQLFGQCPDTLAEAARRLEQTGDYDLIDLNMGCPVPKVVSRGAGAALMRQPGLVETLVRAVAESVALPVTAKTRAGWSEQEINAVEICQAIEQGGGQAVTVHARTRTQKHDGAPLLDLLSRVKQAVKIPVLGNGGIMSPEDGIQMFRETGVDGIMLGRGALGNPWIFQQIDQLLRGETPSTPSDHEIRAMIQFHLEQILIMFDRRQYPRPVIQGSAYFRQQIIRYLRGRPGARAALRRMNEMVDAESTLAILDEHIFTDSRDPSEDRG